MLFAALNVTCACRVKDDVLEGRTFTCDSTVADNLCGTSKDGRAMMCVAGHQLGGADFCADRCAAGEVATASSTCVESGARLATCLPDDPHPTCPPQLSCLRTDAVRNEGVCTWVDSCDVDGDCSDSVRTTCATTFLQQYYGKNPLMRLSRMNCVRTLCKEHQSACPTGEVCLPLTVPNTVPDLCVPECDANLNCPPNYVCYKRLGSSAPNVCLPGMLGFRCVTSEHCMVGDCTDTGAGYRVCSLPCTSDTECQTLGNVRGPFVCVESTPGGGRHCMNPRAFTGSNCQSSSECFAGLRCFTEHPHLGTDSIPECRLPCEPGGKCPFIGGLPTSCVTEGDQSYCYPGRFFVPCTDDSVCLPSLRCMNAPSVDAHDRPTSNPRCTLPCASDTDCSNHWLVENAGYCGPDRVCVLEGRPNRLCTRALECASGKCSPSRSPKEADQGILRCE